VFLNCHIHNKVANCVNYKIKLKQRQSNFERNDKIVFVMARQFTRLCGQKARMLFAFSVTLHDKSCRFISGHFIKSYAELFLIKTYEKKCKLCRFYTIVIN
jgi:hypothetical protein